MIRRELKMFKKDNRYVTKGVNDEVDIRLQLIMWSMIDKLKNEGNVEVDEKRIYMPIYMIMFLENAEMKQFVYKLDLSGME